MCSGSAQGSDHTSAGKQEKVNHFPKSPQLLTVLFWDIPQGQSRYPARKDHFVLFIKQSCCQILPICHYLLPLPPWSLKKRWRLYPTRSLMMPLLRCVGVVLGSLQIFFFPLPDYIFSWVQQFLSPAENSLGKALHPFPESSGGLPKSSPSP